MWTILLDLDDNEHQLAITNKIQRLNILSWNYPFSGKYLTKDTKNDYPNDYLGFHTEQPRKRIIDFTETVWMKSLQLILNKLIFS